MLGPLEIGKRRGAPAPALPGGLATVAELAQQPGIRETLQALAKDRKWVDEQHLQLCRVPAPTFQEGKRAEWFVVQLRALGWDAKIDRAGNVTAVAETDKEQPLVALTAHLDTVLAPREPSEIRVDPDGRLRGPGVSDNGAGLAALLAIARVWKPTGGAGLLLAANVGEEGEGNLSGMRFLCRQSSLCHRLRSFLVLDGPNMDHITTEALACRRFEISVQGPGGHSWSDFGAANPISAISRLVTEFTDARLESNSSIRSAFNFGVVEGGSSVNAIAAAARAKVDLRSENAAMLDEMVSQLSAYLERALQLENERASSGKVSAKLKETGSRPGGRLPESAPILGIVKAVDAHLGIRSHADCASTDANIPLSLGLPAVSIGAGGQGAGAHTPNEWYRSDSRETGLQRIYLILHLLIREAAAAAAVPAK